MPRLRRFENKTEVTLFELRVRNRKSIVLPRVFRPGLHNEILKIYPGLLRIVENAIHPKIAHAHVSGAQKQPHISSREFFQEMRDAGRLKTDCRNLKILSVS